MNQDKVNEIVASYKEFLSNTVEALTLAGVPPAHIPIYLMNFPDLTKMVPEDVVELYRQIQKAVVLYLREIGYSHREISRRLGGSSSTVVWQIVKEQEEALKDPTKGGDNHASQEESPEKL